MNEELLEYYSNIFIASRAEARYTPMIRLSYNLLELGYGERYFTKIYDMEIDDTNTFVDDVERIVLDCFFTEMQRLGIEINLDAAFARPSNASYLLDAILSDIENYEDPDALYQIISVEEAGIYELQEMLRVMHANDGIELTEMVTFISPRIMVMFRSILETMIQDMDDVSDDDLPFAQKIAQYIKYFPQNPESVVFYNLDKESDFTVLYDVLRYDVEGYDNQELAIIYTTGLATVMSQSYDEAYGKAHEILERISPDDDVDVFYVLGKVNEALYAIYESYNILLGDDDEES